MTQLGFEVKHSKTYRKASKVLEKALRISKNLEINSRKISIIQIQSVISVFINLNVTLF